MISLLKLSWFILGTKSQDIAPRATTNKYFLLLFNLMIIFSNNWFIILSIKGQKIMKNVHGDFFIPQKFSLL